MPSQTDQRRDKGPEISFYVEQATNLTMGAMLSDARVVRKFGATMSEHEGERDAEAASEVRHRTANTLQLLATLARMRGQKTSDLEARRQMTWMAEAIGALGALERRRSGDTVDFAAYLEEMAQVWRRRQAGQAVEVVVEVDDLKVRDQAASTLALITNELVGNALTHGLIGAEARLIHITLRREPGGLARLTVADGGPGFDPAAAAGRERFGLWLARSLAGQVRGDLSLGRGPNGGIRAQLTFPV